VKRGTKARVAPATVPECAPADHAPRAAQDAWENSVALERTARLFHAIADVARLRLLARLTQGEWCVTELAQVTGLPMSTVSQQLRTLRAENLVRRRRMAKHIYYGLADDHVIGLIQRALEHAVERPEPADS
jgi:ArsR family transcriptional regulator